MLIDKKNIFLVLTKGCNLYCTYCYEKNFNSDVQYMTLATFKRILKLFPYNVNIELFGGECLMNYKIIDYIIDNFDILNIETLTLSTNGLLLNEKILNFYNNKLGKIHFIISLDGDQDSHDKYRVSKLGTGTYSEIIKNLIKFNNKDYFVINVCITPYSSARFYRGIIDLYKKGFKEFKLIIIYEYNWDNNSIINIIKSFTILKKIKEYYSDISFSGFDKSDFLETINDCKNDMNGKYRFNYNGDLIPCTLQLSEFSSKINLKYKNINNTDFDLDKSHKTIMDYFFKTNIDSSWCDYYSDKKFKTNKNKMNKLFNIL